MLTHFFKLGEKLKLNGNFNFFLKKQQNFSPKKLKILKRIKRLKATTLADLNT